MKEINIEENKKTIIKLLTSTREIHMDKVINWLEETDYFTVPCTTKFHLNIEGGLAQHSLNVYNTFTKLVDIFNLDSSKWKGVDGNDKSTSK